MKVIINPPPSGGRTAEERIRQLEAWARNLADQMNIVLNSIGLENMNSETKELINGGSDDGTE